MQNMLGFVLACDLTILTYADYPKIELEAKSLTKELGFDYIWKNVKFRDANKEDEARIKATLEDEEVMPTNSDWTVKLGINLYYTASLSKSPLYSKQMPYNPVVYKVFGCSSTINSPVKQKASRKRSGRQKKIIVAGRWCGKVWMSNQVHPYLTRRKEIREQEETEELYPPSTHQKPSIEIDMDNPRKVSSKMKPSGGNLIAKNSGKRRKKKPLKKAEVKKPRCRTVADKNSKAEDICGTSTPLGRTLRSTHNKQNGSTSQLKSSLEDESGGPSTRLRKRSSKSDKPKNNKMAVKLSKKRKSKNTQSANFATKDEEQYTCDIEGCSMSFSTKQDLSLHKRDICPVKGCAKKFFSHKYLVQHRKVHMDDRPLACPWKGCKMTFKWPWARTEHIRVHTGDRPYICSESGCGQTFRFVSDFSRHKRKTGHSVKKSRR